MSAVSKPVAKGGQASVSVASRVNYILLGVGVLIIVFFALFPQFASTAWTRRLVEFFYYLALAQFWNLMLGYAGLISVGQQGFIGIGAYTLWFSADVLHIHPYAAVLVAAVAGAIIALPSAGLVFRLRGGYLAIGTWVIAEIMRLVVGNIQAAGGGSGTTITSVLHLARAARGQVTYYWALVAALAAILITYGLLRSRTGLALKAMRDNDLAAESNGVGLMRSKLLVYVIAGAGCALVGAIVALYQFRVQPASAFSISWTAYLIFIVIIGGVGTIEGPIIGTIIFYVLQQLTAKYGEWYFIVLGVLAIVVTIWSPQGIYGWVVRKTNFFLFPVQRKLKMSRPDSSPEGSPEAS